MKTAAGPVFTEAQKIGNRCLWSRSVWIAAMLLVILLFSRLAAAQVTSDPRPRQASKPVFWARRITGYLITRDGVKLRYSVLLPSGPGPFPVAMTYSGYDAGSIGGVGYLHGLPSMDPSIDKSLVESGYAVFGVNARSSGCSEGDSFEFLRPLYGLDGSDAVEFAAVQPWSTGAVGMYNWSWAGMSQLWTASFRPPHLKAIAPGMVIADPRGDSYAPGGVPQPWMISAWPAFLRGRWDGVRESAVEEHDTECLAQLQRNLRAESLNSTARQVLQHPLRDAWLDERTVAQRTHLISVPVLSMTAYQDGATTSRGGYFQDTINPDHLWMIDTNGDHEIYASEAYRPLLIAFFDHFLKEKQNGWERQPRLRIWQEATTSRPQDPFVMGRQEGAAPSWVVNRARPAFIGRSRELRLPSARPFRQPT